MGFVISKDMGEGNPPAFVGTETRLIPINIVWTTLENAQNFINEVDAQALVDTNDALAGCIVMPNDEIIFEGSNIKEVDILSGMKPDTGQNE